MTLRRIAEMGIKKGISLFLAVFQVVLCGACQSASSEYSYQDSMTIWFNQLATNNIDSYMKQVDPEAVFATDLYREEYNTPATCGGTYLYKNVSAFGYRMFASFDNTILTPYHISYYNNTSFDSPLLTFVEAQALTSKLINEWLDFNPGNYSGYCSDDYVICDYIKKRDEYGYEDWSETIYSCEFIDKKKKDEFINSLSPKSFSGGGVSINVWRQREILLKKYRCYNELDVWEASDELYYVRISFVVYEEEFN